MVRHHLNLKGKFKFDLYDKSGSLIRSTEVPNFITPTGLLFYPTQMPFADCFRYISFGSGTTDNTINGNGTTGLATKISKFAYIGGNREDEGNDNQYELNSCGFHENADGVSLFRGWRIPTGNTFFDADYSFKEVMVSPGSPLQGSNCNEEFDLLQVYPNICKYDKAFSRIVSDVNVGQDNYLVASYQLDITVNTGIVTGQVTIQQSNPTIFDPSNWQGTLQYTHSLVHHGLNLIRSPDVSKPSNVPNNFSNAHYGDSFNGPLGGPMEPSCPIGRYAIYLSTDNTEFLVSSSTGGSMDTGLYFPYNSAGLPFPSGTETYHSQPCFETNMGNNLDNTYWFVNIRLEDGDHYPDQSDYRNHGDPTTAGITLVTKANTNLTASYSSLVVSSRSRTRTLQGQFFGVNAGSMANNPVRSAVLAYSGGGGDLYPIVDMVFASQSDQLMPSIDTGSFTFTPQTDFNYLDTTNNLTLQYQLTWSSPCDCHVQGCAGYPC